MNPKAVILFTRIPSPGKVKTRLQPFLSGGECASLQEAFIKDIFATLKKTSADIVVCHTPNEGLEHLKSILDKDVIYIPQKWGGLGDKMHNAIYDVLSLGYSYCLLIGSDVPLLTKEDIEEAFCILEHKDIVVSPTEDGGYYLIGMKEPCPSVFHMKYGGGTVFESTLGIINSMEKTHGIGSAVLDIDDEHDLIKLRNKLKKTVPGQNVHTKKALLTIFDEGDECEQVKCRTDS